MYIILFLKAIMEPASLLNQVDCFAIHALWRNFLHAGFLESILDLIITKLVKSL